jgi:3-methyladenine DNA glycosylase/8-oxoguanine DNA glycosylase
VKTAGFIPVEAPFPWQVLLRYLALRSTPGVERVSADRYERTTAAGGIAVEYDAARGGLRCSGLGARGDAAARVRRLFGTECNVKEVARVLGRSRLLRGRVRNLGGMRVPGCWEPFELCVRVVLGQQVSVKAAHTFMRRLVERCGGPAADGVAAADLSSIGLTGSRIRTIRTLAEQVAAGVIRLEEQPWPEVAAGLRAMGGFGPWTIEYLALRLGRDADAFPASDLGLLRAAGASSAAELRRMAEAWRPYRGYAAMYLWAGAGGVPSTSVYVDAGTVRE